VPWYALPWVSDGGDGLQTWSVSANILNKQFRTADKGWSSSLGFGGGADYYSSLKKKLNLLGYGRKLQGLSFFGRDLTQDTQTWQALLNTVMNLRVPYNEVDFFLLTA
jgi:hypothetical protein